MIIITEITKDNCDNFEGRECRVFVWEHKRGPVLMRHPFHLFGIMVYEEDGLYVHFSNGSKKGPFESATHVIRSTHQLFKFFYIEIR